MLYTIPKEDLRIGMFVILPKWHFDHPEIGNRFLITSEEQLNIILDSDIETIQVDSAMSRASNDFQQITHPVSQKDSEPPAWDPQKEFAEELRAIIRSSEVDPKAKAIAVYDKSLAIMKALFSKPTAQVLGETKKVIAQIVDLILNDEETNQNLMQITSHDFYTYTHSVSVGIYGISLAKRLYKGISGHNLHEIGAGFFLHDLGKIKVSPAILNKPGRLNDDEMKKMRIHPFQSFKILEQANRLSGECRVICLQHHEREDGSGYPGHLSCDQIHDYARVCSIADVYDALTADRSYKKALSPFEALRVMKEEMLGFFDKELFGNLVRLFNAFT
ncbi:MAG: HD-GYP domain-containing protein [Desulfobacula sp.]